MNIFQTMRVYPGKWMLKESRNFNAEEIASVKSATVVDSQYGNSVCMVLTSGSYAYIPLSNDSAGAIGDSVDISKAKLLTLSREGEADIVRIQL